MRVDEAGQQVDTAVDGVPAYAFAAQEGTARPRCATLRTCGILGDREQRADVPVELVLGQWSVCRATVTSYLSATMCANRRGRRRPSPCPVVLASPRNSAPPVDI